MAYKNQSSISAIVCYYVLLYDKNKFINYGRANIGMYPRTKI